MILSAAAQLSYSVETLNDEFVSITVLNLIPRLSPYLLYKDERKTCVIVRHAFVYGRLYLKLPF
jgi:hypothetical protein